MRPCRSRFCMRAKWRLSIDTPTSDSKAKKNLPRVTIHSLSPWAKWNNSFLFASMNTTDFQPFLVTTTSDDRSVLETISNQLIDKQLAACVQISGPIQSCYRWEGKVENSEEWLCTIKTSSPSYCHVEKLVLELHNYDQPQLIGWPIAVGSEGYLNWLRENIKRES